MWIAVMQPTHLPWIGYFDLMDRVHVYEHPIYSQLHGDFCAHASALDLLLNHGPHALAILRSGRRPTLAPDRIDPSKPGGV